MVGAKIVGKHAVGKLGAVGGGIVDVERILCKGMAASEEIATVNCLESPLDFQGIHYSDDISHILPIHALQLENPDLEIMFWRDFSEKRLVTYEHDGGVIDDSNDDYAQMPRAKETLHYLINERAPFVVCLNTPVKIYEKERLAIKLLTLNVMRQCLIEQRGAVVFGFTSRDKSDVVQRHILTPRTHFDGLLELFEICNATFDRSELFHELYSWNTCEHAPPWRAKEVLCSLKYSLPIDISLRCRGHLPFCHQTEECWFTWSSP